MQFCIYVSPPPTSLPLGDAPMGACRGNTRLLAGVKDRRALSGYADARDVNACGASAIRSLQISPAGSAHLSSSSDLSTMLTVHSVHTWRVEDARASETHRRSCARTQRLTLVHIGAPCGMIASSRTPLRTCLRTCTSDTTICACRSLKHNSGPPAFPRALPSSCRRCGAGDRRRQLSDEGSAGRSADAVTKGRRVTSRLP